MATVQHTKTASSPSDLTRDRILALLASLRPLRGVQSFGEATDEANHRGAALIQRLALAAEGIEAPQVRLSAHEVADVLSFLHHSEPVDLARWWQDPEDSPSHVCGYAFVLEVLEASLRGMAVSEAPAMPVALFEDKRDGLHVRIMSAASIVGTVRNALDDDHAEEQAALEVAVQMIHRIDDELDSASWKATEEFCAANPEHPLAVEHRRRMQEVRDMRDAAEAAA